MDLLIPIILIYLIVSEIMSFLPRENDKDERDDDEYEEGYEKRVWRD